jgi:hypothetical protein
LASNTVKRRASYYRIIGDLNPGGDGIEDGIAQANMEALLVNGGLMEADLNNDAATVDEEIGALEMDENL